jgi:Flp pilus assembly protein TadG
MRMLASSAIDARPSGRLPTKRPRPIRRGLRAGVAMVELAAVFPVLVLVFMAVVDVGRMFLMSIAMANAAHAGVLYGAQNATTSTDYTGMQNAAYNDAAGVSGITATASRFCQCSNGSMVQCGSSCSNGNGAITYVKVQTSGTFTTLINYPGLPSSIPLQFTAAMRAQ